MRVLEDILKSLTWQSEAKLEMTGFSLGSSKILVYFGELHQATWSAVICPFSMYFWALDVCKLPEIAWKSQKGNRKCGFGFGFGFDFPLFSALVVES